MANAETITYAGDVKGWPSFYDYLPDYMIGMNQYFYTFKGGNIYRHNVSANRNEYYGVQHPSTITTVFNTDPSTIKLFKTMSYESNDVWTCTELFTDLSTGSMPAISSWRQKEGEWFAFLRENAGTVNLKHRSVQGVGEATAAAGVVGAILITFGSATAQNPGISDSVAVGDIAYGVIAGVQTEIGPITALGSVTIPAVTAGTPFPVVQYNITVDATATGVTPAQIFTAPAPGAFIYAVKDPIAESTGARGYFMHFTLSNSNVEPVELFAVNSNIMKSFP
tara:strand:+ start:8302 stop:9141 length:840 start_codon:yes stop_codon:yes gene_type:complete